MSETLQETDSVNTRIAQASQKQIAANRANAQKSTGPKTAEGKLAVAGNGAHHGICAFCPVIAKLESQQEWSYYHAEMLNSLAPMGMLETVLAERITLTAWRLRRVARYEAEAIREGQDEALEAAGRSYAGYGSKDPASEIQKILSWQKASKRYRRIVKKVRRSTNETLISPQDTCDLLYFFHDYLGIRKTFDAYWRSVGTPASWTVGFVRQQARSLSEHKGKGYDEVLAEIERKMATQYKEAKSKADEVRREISSYQGVHILPDNSDLERIGRYETHLSRLFHKDLHEFQRLQALRQGQTVPASLAIDVDITSTPAAVANAA